MLKSTWLTDWLQMTGWQTGQTYTQIYNTKGENGRDEDLCDYMQIDW